METLIREILTDSRLGLEPARISVGVVDRFHRYIQLWQKWNARTNLTGEHSPEEFLQRHIFISCQYLRGLDDSGRLLDIGSGAGLPGIPLKILYPELEMTLVESRGKRASFLQTVVRELKLDQIEVQSCRVENLPPAYKEAFNRVVFRAVGPLPQCLEMGAPFLKSGGMLRILKTGKEDPFPFPGLSPCPDLEVKGFDNEVLTLLSYIKE